MLRLISAFIEINDELSRSISRSADTMSDLSKHSAFVMWNINKNTRFFFIRVQFLNDDSDRETYHLLLMSQ